MSGVVEIAADEAAPTHTTRGPARSACSRRLPAFTAFGFRAIGPAFAYAAFREEAVPVCLELARVRLAA